jgi:hypothetical protein
MDENHLACLSHAFSYRSGQHTHSEPLEYRLAQAAFAGSFHILHRAKRHILKPDCFLISGRYWAKGAMRAGIQFSNLLS